MPAVAPTLPPATGQGASTGDERCSHSDPPAPRATRPPYQAGQPAAPSLYGPERKGEEERGERWQKYCHWPLSRLLARGDNTAVFVRPLLCKWIRLTAEERLLPAPETTFPLAQVCGHFWTWQPLSDGSVATASLFFLLSGTWGQAPGPRVTWHSSPQGPRCRASPRGCSRRLGGH